MGRWSWGYHIYVNLGTGPTTEDAFSPVQIGTINNWAKVAIAADHVVAIRTDGSMWAWGNNSEGGFGNSAFSSSNIPMQVNNVYTWKDITCGNDVTLAIKTDGTLWATGDNSIGLQANGTNIGNNHSFVQIGTDTDWQTVSLRAAFALAIKTNGTLWGWGFNHHGELGDGTTGDV